MSTKFFKGVESDGVTAFYLTEAAEAWFARSYDVFPSAEGGMVFRHSIEVLLWSFFGRGKQLREIGVAELRALTVALYGEQVARRFD